VFVYVYVRRAKLLLRKKRFQEQILQKTDGQLENLERLVHDLEFSQIEVQVRRFHQIKERNRSEEVACKGWFPLFAFSSSASGVLFEVMFKMNKKYIL
jgi:hypothetical protein